MPILLVLLSLLDADSFRIREAAHAALAQLAPWLWQEMLDVQGQPLEVALRCKQIADKQWAKLPVKVRQEYVAKLLPDKFDRIPWIVHPGDYLTAAHAAGTPNGERCWEDWREAARLMLADAAESFPLSEILGMLEWLAGRERDWIERNYLMWREKGGHRRIWR